MSEDPFDPRMSGRVAAIVLVILAILVTVLVWIAA